MDTCLRDLATRVAVSRWCGGDGKPVKRTARRQVGGHSDGVVLG